MFAGRSLYLFSSSFLSESPKPSAALGFRVQGGSCQNPERHSAMRVGGLQLTRYVMNSGTAKWGIFLCKSESLLTTAA